MMKNKDKKILFVVPPFYAESNEAQRYKKVTAAPYGVLSLISYLQKYAYKNIKLVDYNYVTTDEIYTHFQHILENFKPDIVCLSIMFTQYYPYLEKMSGIAKDINNNVFIIAGGVTVSHTYQKTLQENIGVDAVCVGEGEIALLNIIQSDDIYSACENEPSIITRTGLQSGKEPIHTLVDDLDEIPPIDFSYIDITRQDTVSRPYHIKEKKEIILPIHTTRGCPFHCVFCNAGTNHGSKVRKKSSENVIDEINNMVAQYGMTHLRIDDDQFLADVSNAKKVLNTVVELGITASIASGITLSLIDDELPQYLMKAGINNIILPLESVSKRMLNYIKKPINFNQIIPQINKLRKFGLTITVHFIIGLPYERESDREAILQAGREIGFDWCYFFIALPVPGSRLNKICIENDYCNAEQITTDYRKSYIRAPGVVPDYITEKAYLMNLEMNFVDNYNLRIGNYDRAISMFSTVLDSYPDHAFAHFYIAKSYEGKNLSSPNRNYEELIEKHKQIFYDIINKNKEWKGYAEYFDLIESPYETFFRKEQEEQRQQQLVTINY